MEIFFAQFIRDHFNLTFAKAGPKRNGRRLFIMDNDPSQRSKAAARALAAVEGELLEICPRSPDINCIENVFNLVKRSLQEEAAAKNITSENFEQFSARVSQAFERISVNEIDKIISSMNNRIQSILACKGQRTKY